MSNFGNVIRIEEEKLPKKITIKAMKECFFMDRLLLMPLCRKDLMRGTLILGECLELAFILLNILPKVTSTFTVLEGEPDALCIKTDLATFAIGMNFFGCFDPSLVSILIHLKLP